MGSKPPDMRRTFDSAASCYQQARPAYPSALLEQLVRLAELQADDHLLEVGCATGKATVPLARRGYRITCIELGAELAAAARENLREFPRVEVLHGAFEAYRPASWESYDLVFAATSWHWLDPELRYKRAYELLRRAGHLAFWSATRVFPDGGDPFFREIQPIYEEIGAGLGPNPTFPSPGELPDLCAEIEASGLFANVAVAHFDWEVTYDADAYVGLLDSFSGHIAMEPWQRECLYIEIRRRLDLRSDRKLRRHWGAVLHVARRRD
jgi:SAM-dependent methyltransferase